MTQTPEDLEQQSNFNKGVWKIVLMIGVLLAISPFLAVDEDPFSLIRAAVNKAAVGSLAALMLCKAYVWFDEVFPGSISRVIGGNPIATAILTSSFLVCVAFLVAWA